MVIEKLGQIGEGRRRKELERLVGLVNTFEPEVEDLSDEELAAKTEEFRRRLADGETLDDILPEAFASVREAARRSIGQRHFDVQVMGAIALHQGNIAEMKTGEGKTLTSTMPAYLNALAGERRAHRHGERLPRQAGLRVDGADLSGAGRLGRTDPGADDADRTAPGVRGGPHVRHQQRVRVRLPARQHGHAAGRHGPARPRVRDRGRGRLDPDRRGPDAADHQRHGGGQREVVPDVRPDRAPA